MSGERRKGKIWKFGDLIAWVNAREPKGAIHEIKKSLEVLKGFCTPRKEQKVGCVFNIQY
jgi:hypothetical protein